MSLEYRVRVNLKTREETTEPIERDLERAVILAHIKAKNDQGTNPTIYEVTLFLEEMDFSVLGNRAYHKSRSLRCRIGDFIRELTKEDFLERQEEERTRKWGNNRAPVTKQFNAYRLTEWGTKFLDYFKKKNFEIPTPREFYKI